MCSKQVLKVYHNIAPLLPNPGVGDGVENKDAALVDLPVSLEALNVLQRFLEHGHTQHNGEGQECCDRPARQGACLGYFLGSVGAYNGMKLSYISRSPAL